MLATYLASSSRRRWWPTKSVIKWRQRLLSTTPRLS